MRLAEIATYVNEKISSSNITLDQYVTTDSLLQDKRGREYAQNLPPVTTNLIHYQPGDVLVANIRPYLKKVWFADCEGGASSDVLVLRAKNANDTTFVYALLMQDSFYDYAMKGAKGSKMPRGDKDQIMRYEFPIFSPEQRKDIGKFITDIESKIAVNRQINDNLEAMAKQLYDYWFVQFDFPNEEGKPYKSCGGKMAWNDKLKREIPEGWEVGNLSDYLQVITERVSASTVNESTKYAPIEVLPRKKMSFNECAPIENAISGLCAFRHKNILLSNRRVYFHKVCIAAFDGITRDTVIVLKPNANDLLGYSYQLVNANVFIEYATRHSYGSEQPVLSWESAKMYKVLKPKSGLDVLYSKCADSIIDCVIENELEIANLTKQRDELLPLLMNGQVSVNYHLSHSPYLYSVILYM